MSAPHSAAKAFEAARERRSVRRRSMNTVIDARPMMIRVRATILAGMPMCSQISPIVISIVLSFPSRRRRLRVQLEGDLNDAVHRDRLTLEARGLVLPLLHRRQGGADERFLTAHHRDVGDRAVGANRHLENDRAGLALGAGSLRVVGLAVAVEWNRRVGILRQGNRPDGATRNTTRPTTLEPGRIAVAGLAVDRDALVLARVGLSRLVDRHLLRLDQHLHPWR